MLGFLVEKLENGFRFITVEKKIAPENTNITVQYKEFVFLNLFGPSFLFLESLRLTVSKIAQKYKNSVLK